MELESYSSIEGNVLVTLVYSVFIMLYSVSGRGDSILVTGGGRGHAILQQWICTEPICSKKESLNGYKY